MTNPPTGTSPGQPYQPDDERPGSDQRPGQPDQVTSGSTRRVKWPWIVGAAIAVVVLSAGAVVAYDQLAKDPGVAACEAIRDGQVSPNRQGSDKDMTEAEYKGVRRQFADSRNSDIRDHGTKLVDGIWQIQKMKDDEAIGALALIGPMMQHLAGLQSACADEGVVFTISGFGADPSASAAPDPFGEDSTGAPLPAEGSAAASTSFAWPDGVAVKLDRVEVVDRKLGYEIPKSKSLVKVTFTFNNTGSEPIRIEPRTSWVTVLYGPNRSEGDSEAGYSTDNKAEQLSNQDEPTRIPAGGSAQMWRTYSVPNEGLAVLAVQVDAPSAPGSTGVREPYTFADVEKVLKR